MLRVGDKVLVGIEWEDGEYQRHILAVVYVVYSHGSEVKQSKCAVVMLGGVGDDMDFSGRTTTQWIDWETRVTI